MRGSTLGIALIFIILGFGFFVSYKAATIDHNVEATSTNDIRMEDLGLKIEAILERVNATKEHIIQLESRINTFLEPHLRKVENAVRQLKKQVESGK